MTSARFAKYWMPPLIWLVLIYVGSTDLMSAEHTSRFLGPFLRWLKPDITADAIAKAQLFVRKVAHLTEYAILATLLWRAVYRGTNLKMKMSTLFVIVWLVSTLVAASDEFHQSLVASRTASISDVRVDMIGAIFGLIICRSCTRRALQPLANRYRKSNRWA
jgi:VanZ family protein